MNFFIISGAGCSQVHIELVILEFPLDTDLFLADIFLLCKYVNLYVFQSDIFPVGCHIYIQQN